MFSISPESLLATNRWPNDSGYVNEVIVAVDKAARAKLIKGYGYKAWQTSSFYVLVSIFGLDQAQTTIDFKSVGATDQ